MSTTEAVLGRVPTTTTTAQDPSDPFNLRAAIMDVNNPDADGIIRQAQMVTTQALVNGRPRTVRDMLDLAVNATVLGVQAHNTDTRLHEETLSIRASVDYGSGRILTLTFTCKNDKDTIGRKLIDSALESLEPGTIVTAIGTMTTRRATQNNPNDRTFFSVRSYVVKGHNPKLENYSFTDRFGASTTNGSTSAYIQATGAGPVQMQEPIQDENQEHAEISEEA